MRRKQFAEIISDLYLVIRRTAVIIICLLMVLAVIFGAVKIEKYFHKNYISREIFESINYIYQYDDLIREKEGEYEEKIVYNVLGYPMWLVYCDDIKVVYGYDAEKKKVLDFRYAQVDDSKYVFGEKGLRVGMNKETVKKILANSRIATPNPDSFRVFDNEGTPYYQMGTGYYDDTYWNGLGILYDEENNVEKILIFKGL
ncbi:MAG: hypothetical protein J1F42_14280 [Lachnospiraceae bacterium]|nr:hypothetical protein [Lachnospiraceae bacterium]